MTEAAKDIYIIGGPNGAGKTTVASVLLPNFVRVRKFLNADEIAREIAPEDPESAALAAGRRMIERMHQFARSQESFAFETTCSGKTYLRLVERCKLDGWRFVLLFLWLSSPEEAIARVARRVSGGGHGVPVEVIRRRYFAGIENMMSM